MPTDIYTLPPQPQENQEENNNQSSNTYSLDAHLNDIDAARQQQLLDVDEQQRILNEEFSNYKDPYEALLATKQRTQLIDPRREKARRAVSSLYDALQLIGTFAGMGGFSGGTATPPAPQLASASAKAATAAEQLRLRQQQLDDDLNRSIDNIRQRQATANQQRLRDFNNAAIKLDSRHQAINREADRRRDKAIADDNRRKAAIEKELNKETSSYGNDILINGLFYTIPKNYETMFQAEVADLVDDAGIDYRQYTENAKRSKGQIYRSIIKNILEGNYSVPYNYVQRAKNIVKKFTKQEINIPIYEDNVNNTNSVLMNTENKRGSINRELLFELYKQAHISGHTYAKNFELFLEDFNNPSFTRKFSINYINNFGPFGDLTDANRLYNAIYNFD